MPESDPSASDSAARSAAVATPVPSEFCGTCGARAQPWEEPPVQHWEQPPALRASTQIASEPAKAPKQSRRVDASWKSPLSLAPADTQAPNPNTQASTLQERNHESTVFPQNSASPGLILAPLLERPRASFLAES